MDDPNTPAAGTAGADLAGLAACLRRSCRTLIPLAATVCPECGRRQASVASGTMSGANRRAHRYGEITFRFTSPKEDDR